jgi:hypothetical protein
MAIVLDGTTGISSIGTLTGVTSISSASADTPVILGDSGTNYNTCRAWVNFNGTGTVAIRADFNVTSITDNGTGDYTINFTNAMPDANYSIVATCEDNTKISQYSAATVLAASVRVRVRNLSGTDTDVSVICAAIFR